MEKGRTQSQHLRSDPRFPLKMAEIEKNKQ